MAISITANTENMFVNTHKTYNIKFFDEDIHTTVTASGAVVANWINDIMYYRDLTRDLMVGLDVEWQPFFPAGHRSPVATLQLCVRNRCLVYQIIHADWIPRALADFFTFQISSTTFVGVGIKSDVDKLKSDYGIGCGAYYVDLAGDVAGELKGKGLMELASKVLRKEVEKPRAVRLSRWDNQWLTAEQVQYAAVDAYLSSELGRALALDRLSEFDTATIGIFRADFC